MPIDITGRLNGGNDPHGESRYMVVHPTALGRHLTIASIGIIASFEPNITVHLTDTVWPRKEPCGPTLESSSVRTTDPIFRFPVYDQAPVTGVLPSYHIHGY